MPVFSYKARSKSAKGIVEGEIEGDNVKDASVKLLQSGLIPSSIQEKKGGFDVSSILEVSASLEKVTMEDMILFTSQMSTLFNAGLPLVTSFDGLIEQTDKANLKKALKDIKARVEDGAALNEAMREYPKIFSDTYVNMVMAGEVSGTLDESLQRLTALMEREMETENRIKEVTRYPKIVVGALAVAITVLMSFVVPRFMRIFERAKLELPLPTKILIFLNEMFQNYWWAGLVIFGAVIFAFARYIKTEKGRYQWHYSLLRMPIFGNIVSKIKFAQFSNVLANLLKSGIPILDAIEISGRAAANDHLMKIFMQVRESVREGSGMADPMSKYDMIPPIVVQMVAAGESSGALDEMLIKVSNYFNEIADRKIKQLSSLIEPILLFALGGIVLFLALAIFLPMWDMSKMAH